jgi:phage FluMu gp28-like protein
MPTPRFLPYQARWLNDTSRIKIYEKSRRIGFTYTQSFEDVNDCIAQPKYAVWFSSADLTAAAEYISYAEDWAKLHQRAAKCLGEIVIDEKKGVKAYVLEFKNGARIHALSSNPKAFRSKGGKVVLDEFAWHDDPDAMWKAARPCIMWGFPLRIGSTHNGKNSKFNHFIEEVKAGRLKWSLHTTPIQLAVEEGLADKILQRKLSLAERAAWLEEEHSNCDDEDTWQQEYCCQPTDSASAFLSYDEITACEDPAALMDDLSLVAGELMVGFDVARKRDLTVIDAVERYGGMCWLRKMIVMEKTKFAVQREALWDIMRHPKLRRACLDATGLGMQMGEETQDEFGKYRVEPITFTEQIKEELAYELRRKIEDKAIRIPPDFKLREDLHSVRKVTTASNHIRFDVTRAATDGHADRFWALALAVHAISNDAGPLHLASGGADQGRSVRGYDEPETGKFVLNNQKRNHRIERWPGY